MSPSVANGVGGVGGQQEVRKLRRKVNQNSGRSYCWATCVETNQPCTERVPEDSNIPYCLHHLRAGDSAIEVIDHPTNKDVGKIVVARVDLPKGYKLVYWGRRVRWKGCKGEDRAMSYLQNGGVIDPYDCEGQQLQYMACPGPSERCNTKCTDVCFGKTYDTRFVGREFETSEPVKKNHQLLQWYGSKDWFEAREIPRTNVGTEEHPAPQRRVKVKGRKALKEKDINGNAAPPPQQQQQQQQEAAADSHQEEKASKKLKVDPAAEQKQDLMPAAVQ
eukprot:CAMPEP_0197480256 /NCGR_PEP_ID=MMETSP1309-20131121/39988_1 /TAXON_ID=464262 /ORGANISM="Genus nov. species nov., Strain RCC998" /LENGTH=275 /DNA_ID=CAMNT_0043022177 /DNA_START=43 /DNA_END=870 /DNA_ORIENTATION=+